MLEKNFFIKSLKEAVKRDGETLAYVPEEFRTQEICMEAVKQNGYAFKYVPENLKTSEMWMEAVKQDGEVLDFVPKNLKTQEMCMEAVKQNGYAFKYVPENLKTPEICMEAVKQNGNVLKYVPKNLRTPEICMEAVKEYGHALFYVPENLKTPEMYMEAVKQNGYALRYVPENLKTPEMYMEAVKQDGEVLDFVPKNLKTPEMYMEAVKQNGYALRYVPEEFRTQEMCMEAVKKYGAALREVPYYLKTPEMYMEAVKQDGEVLKYVPENLKTPEICMEAVKQNGNVLKYVPYYLRTPEMCMEAVKQDGKDLEYVPYYLRTPEMCMEAVKQNGHALKYVLLITPEMCMEAIKQNANAIKCVPENLLTIEMVNETVKQGFLADDYLDVLQKADKFNNIVSWIPPITILRKYPEDKIEKFDKKVWWYLSKNELFNVNSDTKGALVEAVLSLGAFDKDETQQERIGMIENMAKFMPKKEFVVDEDYVELTEEDEKLLEEHFEKTGFNYTLNKEALLSDENYLNLFNSEKEAEEELQKLEYVLEEKEILENKNKEYEDKDYEKIMKYIYEIGYDKEEVANKYILKTDIQSLKVKDKKKGNETESKIRNLMYKINPDFMMTPEKIHRIFDGMDCEYKSGFYEFLKNNYEETLSDTKKQSMLSKIQRSWDKIVEANLGLRVTFDKCENYFVNNIYENVEYKEVAKLSSNCNYRQEDFDKAQKIYKKQLERKESSIPQVEGKSKKTGYTYKVLRLDDPVTIFVGELTDCCQAIGNEGESCMIHSAESANGRVLVVMDENDKILSQSWVWRNKNVLCLDNIEAIKKDTNNKKVVGRELLSTIKEAVKDIVDKDKIGKQKYYEEKISALEDKVKNGEITNEEYNEQIKMLEKVVKGQTLNKVTVGEGNTDVNISGLERDDEDRYPEEYVYYISDSRTQFVLYKDESVEHEKNDVKTVAMYQDSDDVKKLIDVDTSEIEDREEYEDDWDYDDDEYDEEYEDNEEYNDKIVFSSLEEDKKIELEDIKSVVSHPKERTKARKALENIIKYLEEKDKNR